MAGFTVGQTVSILLRTVSRADFRRF